MPRMGDIGATVLVELSALRSAHMHFEGDELRMSTLVIDRLYIILQRLAVASPLPLPTGAFH